MAIASTDKLVVVKAFAPGNPLPLDAREIYESFAAAQAYAASNPTAYAGQTIKVVEDGVVTAYYLAPSDVEGENFKLQFAASGEGGVQGVATSTVAGNISVAVAEGDTVVNKDVPVVGALINPVVDEVEHTLTLTKVGATADANTEVVIPLGGASPDTIISAVEAGTEDLTFKVTKFDVESETSTTETVKIFGAVTALDTAVAGAVDTLAQNAAGETVRTRYALAGAVINAAYDAETKVLTLPVVTEVAEDGTITTQDVAIDFKQNVAGAIVDVTATADTDAESAKYTFKYYDATGAEQTKAVFETGVRKVEAGSTVDKIKVTTADTTGALTSTEILIGAGNVKNPTYDAETRKITLPVLQADGTTQALEINLGKDMVVKSGRYDTTTQEIILVLTDDSEVKIPAASLVDVYTGDATATVTVTVSDDNKITAAVKVSAVEGNLVKVGEDGVYVVEADFVATKKLISDAETAAKGHADTVASTAETNAKKHTDDAMTAEVTARNEAIATAKTEAGTAATTYTDGKIDAEVEARNKGDEDTLKAAKEYADTVSKTVSTTWVNFGAEVTE